MSKQNHWLGLNYCVYLSIHVFQILTILKIWNHMHGSIAVQNKLLDIYHPTYYLNSNKFRSYVHNV